MRVARRKMRGKPCYYHLFNRVAGEMDAMLITEADKAYAYAQVLELARYFTLDIISQCWMGNHFHIVLHAAGVAPDLETAANRHNAYYAKRGDTYDPVNHAEICQQIAERMADISEFMKLLQQLVAMNRNRGRGRIGHLWAERFKSSIIGLGEMPPGSIAVEARAETQPGGVWRCVKYVELNPCRAGLVQEPGDYRYSTWGAYRATGEHPFHRNFVHHMRSSLAGMAGAVVGNWSGRQVIEEFRRQLAETLAHEAKQFAARQRMAQSELTHGEPGTGDTQREPVIASVPTTALVPAMAPATASAPPVPHLAEPGRHWIDGGIVGSEHFVRRVASLLAGKDEPSSARLGEVLDGDQSLATLHRLRLTKTCANSASGQ